MMLKQTSTRLHSRNSRQTVDRLTRKKMAAITATAAEVIEHLEASHGNIRYAAKSLNTSRQTLHKYINAHPTVADALEDIREGEIDDAELMLYDRMRTSDTLLIFFLKTRGKDRGYNERNQFAISGPDGDPLTIVVKYAND